MVSIQKMTKNHLLSLVAITAITTAAHFTKSTNDIKNSPKTEYISNTAGQNEDTNNATIPYNAAMFGFLPSLLYGRKRRTDVNMKNKNGYTIGHSAIKKGDIATFTTVVEDKNFDINIRTSNKHNNNLSYIQMILNNKKFTIAQKRDFLSIIVKKAVSDENYDPNATNATETSKKGYTDVQQLLWEGYTEEALELMKHKKFDVSKREDGGDEESYIGIILNSKYISQKQDLLDTTIDMCISNENYNPNSINHYGYTDVMQLIDNMYYKEAVKIVNLDKFDIKIRSYLENESYIQLLLKSGYSCSLDDKTTLLNKLIEKALADANYSPYTNGNGQIRSDYDALFNHSFRTYIDEFERLIEHVNFDITKGSYVYQISSVTGDKRDVAKRILNTLIDKGLENPNYNPNIRIKDKYITPDIISLIKHGYAEEAIRIMGSDIFNVSANQNDNANRCLKIILENEKISRNYKNTLVKLYINKALSDKKYAPYFTDYCGNTDMHLLAEHGYLDEFKSMLQKFTDFDLNSRNKNGHTVSELYQTECIRQSIII